MPPGRVKVRTARGNPTKPLRSRPTCRLTRGDRMRDAHSTASQPRLAAIPGRRLWSGDRSSLGELLAVRVLAIETSGRVGSVALLELSGSEPVVLAERRLPVAERTARSLLPCVS